MVTKQEIEMMLAELKKLETELNQMAASRRLTEGGINRAKRKLTKAKEQVSKW